MKILHLAGGMNLDAGGPPRSIANSVLGCLGAGLDVTLAFPDAEPGKLLGRSDLSRISNRGGLIEAFSLSPSSSGLARRYGLSLPLLRYIVLQADRFDVVHLRGAWLAGSLAAALRGKWNRTRIGPRPLVVLSPHETLTQFDLSLSRSRVTRALKLLGRRAIERGVDAIIYSSELERQDSAHDGEPPRSFVVHHPVLGCAPARSIPAENDGGLRVGFLGRFHPKKNLAKLMGAVADLAANTRITLDVAGMGAVDEVDRLRELASKLGLADRVHWRGFVDGEAKLCFLRSIDLLAMPSAYECFGMAAAEALACGTPVLVGERVGVAPVVRRYNCGFVVPPRVDAIGAAIGTAARNPGLVAAMAARAVIAAREEFSVEAHGAALRRIYEEMAMNRSPGHEARKEL